MEKLITFLQLTRAYSLPMSFMAWLIPFSFAISNGGNWFFGIVSLVGILCVHLGANLFDDIVDYNKFLKNKQDKSGLNVIKGKCSLFIEQKIGLRTACITSSILFFIALVIGLLFIYIYKLPILVIVLFAGLLCLIYPKSGYFGMSEVIIGLIFSPLVFSGVYYVMTGTFSQTLEILSVSFAIVVVSLLYTDFFLDYHTDLASGKRTLVVLSGSKLNAYHLYIFLLFIIYANLFLGIHFHIFSAKYFLIFLSVFPAMTTIKNLQHYIDKEIKQEKEFLQIMNDVQKFAASFSLLCVIVFMLD